MADEPELNVVVDPPEEPVPDVVVEGGTQKTNGAAPPANDSAMLDLKAQYADMEEQRRQALERERRANDAAERARQEAQSARTQVHDSRLETITTALEATRSDAERAGEDIKSAVEAGDAAAQADAYRRLAKAEAQIIRLEEGKADIEARKTSPSQREERRAPTDPVEAYVEGRSKPTADWIRAHPEFVTNQSKTAKLTAAHWDAVGEGLQPDTQQYFDHVEQFLGLKTPAEDAPRLANGGAAAKAPNTTTPQRRPPAPPVAPGAATSTNGGGVPEVRLSAGEARAATDGTVIFNYDDPTGKNRWKKGDPIGIQEFARRKLARAQQGLD